MLLLNSFELDKMLLLNSFELDTLLLLNSLELDTLLLLNSLELDTLLLLNSFELDIFPQSYYFFSECIFMLLDLDPFASAICLMTKKCK